MKLMIKCPKCGCERVYKSKNSLRDLYYKSSKALCFRCGKSYTITPKKGSSNIVMIIDMFG